MTNDKQQQQLEATKGASGQVDALQNQLGNMLSGVERSLAVTCESIMNKMNQLEEKIQDMEKRYTDLAKEAEKGLKEVEETPAETKSTDESAEPEK